MVVIRKLAGTASLTANEANALRVTWRYPPQLTATFRRQFVPMMALENLSRAFDERVVVRTQMKGRAIRARKSPADLPITSIALTRAKTGDCRPY